MQTCVLGRERRRFGMTVYWNQWRSLDWIVTDKKGDQINLIATSPTLLLHSVSVSGDE